MFLIYTAKQSSRVNYILDFIFSDILRMPYSLTKNKEEFRHSSLPKINYSDSRIDDEFFIASTNLLFEIGKKKPKIEYSRWGNNVTFFKVENSDLPFDVFAASFYLISRYEEYLTHSIDKHGRYRAEESTAYKGGFLEKPIIDHWVYEFKKLLKNKYPNVDFPSRDYQYSPTIDIDNAYAYKYKGMVRSGVHLVNQLLNFRFKKFTKRVAIHGGLREDPYDSYEKQEKLHTKYSIKPLYFILIGDYGQYDRNLSHKNKHMIQLVQRLGKHGTIGLHPSYNSNRKEGQLSKEKERLEKMIEKEISKSRQHYIKLQIPKTYRTLLEAGIKEDYSMGYPSATGFRASTCTSFKFYDLEKEEVTPLLIHPFVAMDTTLKQYAGLKEKEVVPYLRPIVQEIKKVEGNFTFIFHNESIGNGREWKNWGDLYEKVIKLAMEELED